MSPASRAWRAGLWPALAVLLTLWAAPAFAQDAPPTEAPARLKGSWQLNKELSSKIPEPPPPAATGPGARGGRGANEKKDNEPPPKDPPEVVQLRVAMREVNPPPNMLFIAASPTEVGFTTEDGTVRRFTTDGQRQRVEIGTTRVEAKTTWSPAFLSQELVAGPIRLIRQWAVTERDQLVLTVRIEGASNRTVAAAPMILVYDRIK